MAKKREMRKTKVLKQRSIIITFFLMIGWLFFWLTKCLYYCMRTNASLVVGFLLFIISLGFVSFNALFSQINMNQDAYIQMKLERSSTVDQDAILFKQQTISHTDGVQISSVPIPRIFRKNVPSEQSLLQENLLKMQQKLTKLGFYDGPLDGLDGPKMRRAIALWKEKMAHKDMLVQKNSLQKYSEDEIAKIINRSKKEMINNALKVNAVADSKDTFVKPSVSDVMRVQEALRFFGDSEIVVTGREDQKTQNALKQFQKIFNLPITGKIDRKVLIKMREIGLLS
ncbi:peptidoglycan-binding domain-containing protein [Bartonella sp. F02]|uniref:peptidoglycan-binding domain-containing protein n=1 Tax=Bartonella sp. F02 TaxID=2967262 RepID=UPI0022A8DEEB|nr:peptidoglycan-binding protein [Bartonella sp. F02]MCZ2328497.1 peptidoglycan-binding protein [Bartonella sp. F02]